MKSVIRFFTLGAIFAFAMSSCNVQNIEKYNEEFKGEWRTGVYYSPTKSDSIRNFLTIDGINSGFGIACKKNDPFEKCLYFQTGKVRYNKASKGIQVGNSVQQIHSVDKEPFINNSGSWELVIDSISYYKY
ncbi:MAG TPA: hypothetical protein VKY37_05475 [Brumimicrobium sp.]|nr:hypothetical protein [Brumimicrobium sp.]